MVKTILLDKFETYKIKKNRFSYYIICNKTVIKEKVILDLIQKKAEKLYVIGKYAHKVEEIYYKISQNEDETLFCPFDDLEQFILELTDSDKIYQENVIFVYDDNRLMEFVLKESKKLTEIRKTTPKIDHHSYMVNNMQYSKKQFYNKLYEIEASTKRAELNCHTIEKLRNFNSLSEIINKSCSNALYGIIIMKHIFKKFLSIKNNIEYYKSKNLNNIKFIFGEEIYLKTKNYINIIAKNINGIEDIKRIIAEISHSNICLENKSIEEIVYNKKNNILVSLPIYNHYLYNFAKQNDIENLVKLIKKYDYVEVSPIPMYQKYYKNESDDNIKKIIMNVIEAAKKANVFCVATSCPIYIKPTSEFKYSVLHDCPEDDVSCRNADLHIYSTAEMKYAFDWLDNDCLVDEIVVTNTHKIVNMCEWF